MANLIITIISIALVAVAALMGAYYGGNAFLQGQAKAQANSLVNKGQQIGAAWQIYAADHGGSRTITPFSSLVPAYLQAAPVNDFEPGSPVFSGWHVIYSGDDASIDDLNDGDSVIAQINSANVCLAVHQMSAGSAATLTDAGSGDPFGAGIAILPANGKFDCFYYANDSTYFFLYKVF